jgi:hypothetical protein
MHSASENASEQRRQLRTGRFELAAQPELSRHARRDCFDALTTRSCRVFSISGERADEVSAALTLVESVALEDDVEGALVDGVLGAEDWPSDLHELAVAWLLAELTRRVLPRGGYAFGSRRKLAVTRRRGRKGDVSVHLPRRADAARSISHGHARVVSRER